MRWLVGLLVVFATALPVWAQDQIEPELRDGIYRQAWFMDSFMDLSEDLTESADENKRLAIVFEQKGCIYCKRIHTEVLSSPEINAYVRENFNVQSINLFGDLEVTDFDGEVLSEKQLARKWGVLFTPTFVFLPDPTTRSITDAPGIEQAVASMPGAFGRGTFTALFEWIKAEAYDGDEHFQKFVARRVPELREAGILSNN